MPVTAPAYRPVPQPLGLFRNKQGPRCRAAKDGGGVQGAWGPQWGYLDGGGAALLVLALAQQAVGLHVVARHWHGLHHMQAVAATDRHGRGLGQLGPGEGALGEEGLESPFLAPVLPLSSSPNCTYSAGTKSIQVLRARPSAAWSHAVLALGGLPSQRL